jgi:hypothetical protein
VLAGIVSPLAMQTCAYCGRENEDVVAVCIECGAAEFKSQPSARTERGDSPPTEESGLRALLAQSAEMSRTLVLV